MMKKKVCLLISLSCCCGLYAQETKTVKSADVPSAEWAVQPVGTETPTIEEKAIKPRHKDFQSADTVLALPPMNYRGGWSTGPYCWGGYWGPFGGWNDWQLHGGLNVSLSAAATVGLGRNSLSGFSQTASLMYAVPLSSRMSLAIGGYYSHFNLGHSDFNDAGINAVLGYRFNDRWEAYVYAQKSVATPKLPRYLYDFSNIGDKIGAEVRYNLSPSTTIGVSFWYQNVPDGQLPARRGLEERPFR